MENVQLRFVFDRKRQANNDTKKGLLQIEVRLTGTNVRKQISTQIYLYRHQFSDRNGFTCRNHDNAPAITGKAAKLFRRIEAFVLSDGCASLDDVHNWDKDPALTTAIVDFMRNSLKNRNPTDTTRQQHSIMINQVEAFGKMRTFSDLTYNNIADFDVFLRKTITSPPVLYKRHLCFRSYITEAINRGLCKGNPYLQFKLHKGKGKNPTFLNESEIRLILDYTPEIQKIQHVKDMFIFQCFTGLSFADLNRFTASDVSEQDGVKVIQSNRKKTDESFVCLLLPQAEKIAVKYGYELPRMTNQRYNDYLKILAAGSGIKKNLTAHVARHTFATYLINKDVPIESVSKALGHSNIKQTQHYAKLAGKKVINDMKKLLI